MADQRGGDPDRHRPPRDRTQGARATSRGRRQARRSIAACTDEEPGGERRTRPDEAQAARADDRCPSPSSAGALAAWALAYPDRQTRGSPWRRPGHTADPGSWRRGARTRRRGRPAARTAQAGDARGASLGQAHAHGAGRRAAAQRLGGLQPARSRRRKATHPRRGRVGLDGAARSGCGVRGGEAGGDLADVGPEPDRPGGGRGRPARRRPRAATARRPTRGRDVAAWS